jgi:hypothetical protein
MAKKNNSSKVDLKKKKDFASLQQTLLRKVLKRSS